MEDWIRYDKAVLLKRPPHSNNADISSDDCVRVLNRLGGYFARYTSNFDKATQKEWWYCIKDDKVYLEKLTSKQRYRINKGLKNVDIVRVSGSDAIKHAEDLYALALKKLEEYPAQYRPSICKKNYVNSVINNALVQDYWLCKDKESGEFCGYAKCVINGDVVNLAGVKVLQQYLKLEVNAALIYKISEYYLNQCNKAYICDGERNIRHQTSYQDYLCKVVNFRYAYCNLNVCYSPKIKWMIPIIYLFRTPIKYISQYSKLLYNVSCLLEQERIARLYR